MSSANLKVLHSVHLITTTNNMLLFLFWKESFSGFPYFWNLLMTTNFYKFASFGAL